MVIACVLLLIVAGCNPDDGGGGDSGEDRSGEDRSFDVTSFRNFDGSTGTDMDQADIQISGNSNYPDISWYRSDATLIQVNDDQDTQLYGIGASLDAEDNFIFLTAPIQYGDYSISDTFRLPLFPSTSPAIIETGSYSITIGIESGAFAHLEFTVR